MSCSPRETAGTDADACAACGGLLICPVCGERLVGDGRTLRCARGHSFDRAREGYYHLLPVGHGRSGARGDTREMARARRRVFERSVFEPLADAIAACVAAEPGRERFSVLDVGCGEGYYIGSVARSVATSTVQAACFIGVDVSKETLKLAARAHRSVCFLVNAARYRLTVADGSIDVLLDVFAPRNAAEFTRVVRDGGLLLVAIPLAHHLRELRERLPLLGIEDRKRQRAIDQLGAAFALERAQSVEYTRVLASDAVLDLLRMTPNAWHLDTAAFEQVGSWGPLEVTFGVEVLALRKIVPGTHFSEIRARHEFSGSGTDPADST